MKPIEWYNKFKHRKIKTSIEQLVTLIMLYANDEGCHVDEGDVVGTLYELCLIRSALHSKDSNLLYDETLKQMFKGF